MPFLPPNQECQSTEGTKKKLAVEVKSPFVFSGVYVTFVLSFQLLLLLFLFNLALTTTNLLLHLFLNSMNLPVRH